MTMVTPAESEMVPDQVVVSVVQAVESRTPREASRQMKCCFKLVIQVRLVLVVVCKMLSFRT